MGANEQREAKRQELMRRREVCDGCHLEVSPLHIRPVPVNGGEQASDWRFLCQSCRGKQAAA